MREAAREDGQVLVLFVVGLTVFVLLGALVVDVGAWFQVQRKVQSVADAAALAGAQQLPCPSCAQATAQQYATVNSSAVKVDSINVRGGTVDVSTSAPLSAYFAFGIALAGKRARANASARVDPAQAVTNASSGCNAGTPAPCAKLRQSGPPAGFAIVPYLAPLVFSEDAASCVTDGSCLGATRTMNFGSDFAFICTESSSCTRSRGSGGRTTIRNWLRCSPCLSRTYGVGEAPRHAVPAASNGLGGTLQGISDDRLLVAPVLAPGGAIAGFAGVVIRGVPVWTSDDKELTIQFMTYTAPASLSPSGVAAANYGVRAIGLTS